MSNQTAETNLNRVGRWAMRFMLLVAGVSIALGMGTLVYWYLLIRQGIAGPYFFYDYGSLRTPALVFVLTPVVFLALSWFAGRARLSIRTSARILLKDNAKVGIRLVLAIVFLLGLAVVLAADHTPPTGKSDQTHYYNTALSFLSGEQPMMFAKRGHVGLLWAVVFFITGPGVLPVMLLHLILGVLSVYLVFRITLLLSNSPAAALLVAAAFGLFPSQVFFARQLMSEVPFLFFSLCAFLFLGRVVSNAGSDDYWNSRRWLWDCLLCGLFLGISHWVRPLAIVLWLIVLIMLSSIVYRFPPANARRIGAAMAVVTCVFALSVSWLVVANHRIQGELSPIYMEGRGFLYLVGTQPVQKGPTENGATVKSINALDRLRIAYEQRYGGHWQTFGEKQVQDFARQMAWSEVRAEPAAYLANASTENMAQLWTSQNGWYVIESDFEAAVAKIGEIVWWALLPLAVVGAMALMVAGAGRADSLILLAALIVGSCSVLHVLVSPFSRYHFHTLPWLFILVIFGGKVVYDRLCNLRREGTGVCQESA